MYESLTKYLPLLPDDDIGEWHFDQENDGTIEHPIQMPFIIYSKMVHHFIHDIYEFVDNNPEMQLTSYNKILNANGIEWSGNSMQEADVTKVNAQCVMALLVGAVRAERFCDGALLGFFKDGTIAKWLKRLSELDCQ